MMNRNSGFTLIELVVVIVVLGILAVTAIPRFIDLTDDANEAAVQGVAGAISSAAAINYAQCKSDSTDPECTVVDTCADAAGLLQGGALPTGFAFSAPTTAIADDATGTCTVQDTSGAYTADAFVIGT